MKKILFTVLTLIIVALFGCANSELTDREQTYVDCINNVRLDNGLNKLKLDEQISISAQKRCDYIVKKGLVEHAPLKKFVRNISHTDNTRVGEIIAKTYKEANHNEVLNAWLRSETHKDIILNKLYKFERIGVSITDFGDGEIIIILFASR